MGFDMYWNEPATDEEIAAHEGETPDYFRLSIFEMPKAIGLMILQRMADEGKREKRLPTPAAFGLRYVPERLDPEGNAIEYAPGSAEERYLVARETARDGDSGGVIPLYKLCSNDGWLVTTGEIERSLAAYEAMFPTSELPTALPWPVLREGWSGEPVNDDWIEDIEMIEWWGEWIDFLRAAAVHGGFRVF